MKNPHHVIWGGLPHRSETASNHFAAIGSTGSGKTVNLRALMTSAFPLIGSGAGHRALVYDAKQDITSILEGIKRQTNSVWNYISLNPFDARGYGWNMAEDLTSPAAAQQLAATLIPPDKSSNPFFTDAARDLLRGVVTGLILEYTLCRKCGGKSRDNPKVTCAACSGTPGFRDRKTSESRPPWTLAEVVKKLTGPPDELFAFYTKNPATWNCTVYFAEERVFTSVLTTLKTKMAPYEVIASLWRDAKLLSLDGWLNGGERFAEISGNRYGESVLILGNNEVAREGLDAINRVMFKRLSELVCGQTEGSTRRTWFFLDEVRLAGKLDGLDALLFKGRSKGACVVLGLQDIEGLQEVYGPRVANELLGQCLNKALLKMSSPETALWSSRVVGSRERRETRYGRGTSSGPQGSSENASESEEQKITDALLPSEFTGLHPARDEYGIEGYYLSPDMGVWHYHLTPEKLKNQQFLPLPCIPPNEPDINFRPRGDSDQWINPISVTPEQMKDFLSKHQWQEKSAEPKRPTHGAPEQESPRRGDDGYRDEPTIMYQLPAPDRATLTVQHFLEILISDAP